MEKVIRGRKYNTETAKKLYSSKNESFYQKRNGEYFLYGDLSPNTVFSDHRFLDFHYDPLYYDVRNFNIRDRILPLGKRDNDFKKWAENHMSVDEYIETFGEENFKEKAIRNAFNKHFYGEGDFILRCLDSGEDGKVIKSFLYESATWNDFVYKLKNLDSDIAFKSQAWGLMARYLHFRFRYDESKLVAKYRTDCDIGSVGVGDFNGTCQFYVPNGHGDGDCYVYFFKSSTEPFNTNQVSFFTRLDGDFQMYDYDCDSPSPASERSVTFKGTFYTYYYGRNVIFLGDEDSIIE